MNKQAGGANEGGEAVDNVAAAGATCLVVLPEYGALDLPFVLGIFDGVRCCALCDDEVLEAEGVTILLMEDGTLKTPGVRLHHRCAGRIAGAIERKYAELGERARQEIDAAEARIGIGHA